MLKLWDKFLTEFKHVIMLDKEKGFIYLRSFLWYTDRKLPEYHQQELVQLLGKHLSAADQESIMRTIAEKYIDEGIEKGIVQGIQIGKAEGEYHQAVVIAKNMLSKGSDPAFVIAVTGLDKAVVLSLIQSK